MEKRGNPCRGAFNNYEPKMTAAMPQFSECHLGELVIGLFMGIINPSDDLQLLEEAAMKERFEVIIKVVFNFDDLKTSKNIICVLFSFFNVKQ